MRDLLKFKKLLNEFRSLSFEGEYIEDILLEAHDDFENAYQEFVKEHEIDLEELTGKNKEKVEKIVEQTAEEYFHEPKGEPEELSKFKKTHRKLVMLLHPDRQDQSDPRREEREEDFKKLTSAIDDGLWAIFFDIADKYGVDIVEIEEANKLLIEDIEKMEGKIKGKKSTFSWYLNQCEDDECRERVVRTFLNFMYGWSGEEGS
jgi:hypothetical protein